MEAWLKLLMERTGKVCHLPAALKELSRQSCLLERPSEDWGIAIAGNSLAAGHGSLRSQSLGWEKPITMTYFRGMAYIVQILRNPAMAYFMGMSYFWGNMVLVSFFLCVYF